MQGHELIGAASTLGSPAPYWLLLFFKILGFVLHSVPMSLWYAGIIAALLMRLRGGRHARRFAARLMAQMPIIISVGVNLGIVPLLFMQVAYYRVFYPATILMAWMWLMVVALLMFAYYGVYYYVVGLKLRRLTAWHLTAGWGAALLFIVIGFIFANALSLMTNVGAWPELWAESNVGGAVLGIGHNHADPTLWPRWLMMFGLALTTVAAYMVFDAQVFAGRETAEYRRWARATALKVYTVGIIWFAAAGSWYVFGTWPAEVREAMLSGPHLVLTVLTALAPGLPLVLIALTPRRVTPLLAWLIALAQFGVLALNGISRQWVQNLELAPFLDVAAEPLNPQWDVLTLFLVLFIAGLVLVGWMIAKVVEVQRGETRA